jgi:DNA-binding NarL/FixJ family response regulator
VGLSEEEIDLLQEIAEGASRKKVAEKLGVSSRELRSRIDRVLEKLRSRSSGGRIEGTHETPRCPRCRRDLGETGAVVTLDLAVEGSDQTRAVSFAYCRRCGTWLGTV